MNSPSTPKRGHRRVALVALMVVASLSASACDAGSAKVATVNGMKVTSPHFARGVEIFAKLSGATTLANAAGVSPMSNAAQYTLFLVQSEAIEALNEKHGSTVSQAEMAEMKKELLASQNGAELRKAPDWFIDQVVSEQANYQTLVRYYGARVDNEARIKAYYQANKAQFRQVCMDVIGAQEASQLDAARQQLEDGKKFGVVAQAVAAEQPAGSSAATALGTKKDGDVGCIPTANLSSLFADPAQVAILTDASKNQLIGPVAIAGGAYMLFRVRSVTVASLELATPTITQALGTPGESEAQAAVGNYLKTATIDLNPRLGSWKTGVGYSPPRGAVQPERSTTTMPTGIGGG